MNRQLVCYFDNCVFSEFLKPDAKIRREDFTSFPHRIAFSDVHIHEMRGNHEEYSALLNDLDAVFIRNPGQIHERYHSVSSLDSAEPEERFADYFKFMSAHDACETLIAPIHHLLGGKREISMNQIADEVDAEISKVLKQLLSAVPDGDQAEFWRSLEETTKGLASIDASNGWQRRDALISAARLGDPMREMNPIEKARHVISKLDELERRCFTELYPEKFAQHRILKTGELAGLAFALFALGLTKQKGIFTGVRQEQKFTAQFRDARHIEEASRCDVFLTFDHDASELAASTFAYAGFATTSVLLS